MGTRKLLLTTGFVAFFLLTVLAQSAVTGHYRQRLPEGEVNWYEGWIRIPVKVPYAQGVPKAQAKVDARRVAVMKAQAAALRLAMRVPVDADRRLEEFEGLRVKVQGIVRGGKVLDECEAGAGLHITYQVPLSGVQGISSEVVAVLVPELELPPPAPEPESSISPPPQAGTPTPTAEPPRPKSRGLSSFAAIRVEAEDAGAKPALCPKIVDPEGKPVYSAASVKPEVARTKSIARYVSRDERTEEVRPSSPWGGTLPLALVDPRRWLLAQQQPPPPPPPPPPVPMPKQYEYQAPTLREFEEQELVVKAVSAKGKLKADLVVTAEDAKKMRANASLLEEANVVVVVRTDVGGVESQKRSKAAGILFGRR